MSYIGIHGWVAIIASAVALRYVGGYVLWSFKEAVRARHIARIWAAGVSTGGPIHYGRTHEAVFELAKGSFAACPSKHYRLVLVSTTRGYYCSAIVDSRYKSLEPATLRAYLSNVLMYALTHSAPEVRSSIKSFGYPVAYADCTEGGEARDYKSFLGGVK